MSRQTRKSDFGIKGKDELAHSYGEMLLSGRAMEKRKSVHIKHEPKFKPRPKMAFGRKDENTEVQAERKGDKTDVRLPSIAKHRNWKKIVLWGVAIAPIVLVVALVLNLPLLT